MGFSLVQSLHSVPVAFVDVETTGAPADYGHRITELGILRMEGGKVAVEYEQLVDPQRKISPGVSALTGITQSMVDGQPTFADALPAALPLLQGAIIVGHNVRFDLDFLRRDMRSTGVDMDAVLPGAMVIDTVRLARRRLGRGRNGLQRLAPRLGYVPPIAHRALADCRTTAYIFEQLLAPLGGWNMLLCDVLKLQGGPMSLKAPASPSLLPLELEEALEQKTAVMMEYLDAADARTQRLIRPLHVRRRNGELMLIAHCELRNDQRTFRVDRIVRLTRPDGSAQEAGQMNLFDVSTDDNNPSA